jgi:hypothetical protein
MVTIDPRELGSALVDGRSTALGENDVSERKDERLQSS